MGCFIQPNHLPLLDMLAFREFSPSGKQGRPQNPLWQVMPNGVVHVSEAPLTGPGGWMGKDVPDLAENSWTVNLT